MGFLNLGQLSIGFGIGFSSVLIPQLQDPQDQTFSKVKIEVGVTEISWIVSLISIGQIAGSVIGAFLASAIGRKGLLIFLLPVKKFLSEGAVLLSVVPSPGSAHSPLIHIS